MNIPGLRSVATRGLRKLGLISQDSVRQPLYSVFCRRRPRTSGRLLYLYGVRFRRASPRRDSLPDLSDRDHSWVPGRFRLKQPAQPGIVLGRAIENAYEPLERLPGQCGIAPVPQHRFGFAAGRAQHEIGPAPAKRFRRAVNQKSLFSAGAQCYDLVASRFVWLWHKSA